MEALKMEKRIDRWNDDRLDELSGRVDTGFAKVDREMKEGFARVDREMNRRFEKADRKIDGEFENVKREFGRLNDRLDKLFYGVGFVGLTIGLNILADKV